MNHFKSRLVVFIAGIVGWPLRQARRFLNKMEAVDRWGYAALSNNISSDVECNKPSAVHFLGDVTLGSRVRIILHETGVLKVGERCFVDRESNIHSGGGIITVGAGSFLGWGSNITTGTADLWIGQKVMIAPYVAIYAVKHCVDRRDVPMIKQGMNSIGVTISDDVWIGTHAVILPGVHIGRGAIVGAGSVVTHDIPEYEIWAGAPAKFIKNRP